MWCHHRDQTRDHIRGSDAQSSSQGSSDRTGSALSHRRSSIVNRKSSPSQGVASASEEGVGCRVLGAEGPRRRRAGAARNRIKATAKIASRMPSRRGRRLRSSNSLGSLGSNSRPHSGQRCSPSAAGASPLKLYLQPRQRMVGIRSVSQSLALMLPKACISTCARMMKMNMSSTKKVMHSSEGMRARRRSTRIRRRSLTKSCRCRGSEYECGLCGSNARPHSGQRCSPSAAGASPLKLYLHPRQRIEPS